MSDFIHELETELRAASQRPWRLAAARAPRPTAAGAAASTSVLVVIAVCGAFLLGHRPRPAAVPTRPSTSGALRPRPAANTSNPVIRRCLATGAVSRGFSATQLRAARSALTSGERRYTNCQAAIAKALLRDGRVQAAAQRADALRVVRQCLNSGRVASFDSRALEDGLRALTPAQRKYTDCRAVIRDALRRANSGSG
jgi:hypothetical protein